MSTLPRVALTGSDRHELRPHTLEPRCHPDERHEVTVMLSSCLTDNEVDLLRGFAMDHGLVVVEHSRPQAKMILSGRTANLNGAFGVDLLHREGDHGSHCCHYGPVTVPESISRLVEGVFGLDKRPVAKPHYRKLDHMVRYCAAKVASDEVWDAHPGIDEAGQSLSAWQEVNVKARVAEKAAFKQPPGSFTPLQVASLYNFPEATGAGECIAIIELGGGYSVTDLKTYFAELGVPMPTVTSVSVDHAQNKTGSDADGEVMLDIEVAGAIAPKAKIAVYFAPNTDQGFLDAINAAIHDSTNKPSVISISWGGPECSWSHAAMTAMDKLFQAAASLGITVTVASGDDGSNDGVGDDFNHVDFPASSPNVLACGGTRLTVTNGVINEVTWNELASNEGAGGGGFSTFFAEPSYQNAGRPAHWRGVPDVSGNADPNSGYLTRVDGSDGVIGGTSAVAPLMAGLVARLNQINGKSSGLLNSVLYANPSVCRDITVGNNGGYFAEIGWDATSGLGVVNGEKLAAVLT